MSSSYTQYYKNTRFSQKDQEKLTSSFQEFPVIFNTSWNLIRNNFKIAWLFPALWNFLIQFIITIVTAGLVVVTALESELVKNWQDYQSKTPSSQVVLTFFGTIFLSLVIPTLVSALAQYWIQIKQYTILNNSEITGVWKTKGNLLDTLWKAVLGQTILFLTYLPFFAFSIAFFVFGAGSIVRFIVDSSTSTKIDEATRTFFSVFEASIGLGFLFIFLGLVVAALSLFIPAFFGLFEQLIIHENLAPWDALKTSYRLSIQKFWPNILRWLVFTLVLFGISIGISTVQNMISSILQLGAITSSVPDRNGSTFSNQTSNVILIFAGMLGAVFQIISTFILWALVTSFNYVAFYNFRSTVIDPQSAINSNQEVL